jgi:hypothetical protein
MTAVSPNLPRLSQRGVLTLSSTHTPTRNDGPTILTPAPPKAA